MSGSALRVELERALPRSVPAGRGTAVLCQGSCWHPATEITELTLLVDGVRHEPAAAGLPRPDIRAAAGADDPAGRSFCSGFSATVQLPAREPAGVIELELSACLATGARAHVQLARIDVLASPAPPITSCRPERHDAPLIAICMATFEPDEALFRTQVQSLREQQDQSWVCLISDDCSGPEHLAMIAHVLAGDKRFFLSRADQRRGFYRNFERALGLVPAEATLVALCDQDDRWYPEKLELLRSSIGDAQLVYSDQRLVNEDGYVLRDTLWRGRQNNHTNLASMVVANTITGAATLFRSELAAQMLPFPDPPGYQFHDHWLGLLALATGEIAYFPRPLYDYVQHAGAVFGDVARGPRLRHTYPRIRPRRAWTAARGAYFYGFLSREVMVQAVLARCGDSLARPKRRALERFSLCDRSLAALLWLGARTLRELAGRNETLGSEWALVRGILWRRLTSATKRGDASPPSLDSFSQHRLRRWRARV